jgi:CheY-like chemotaxis protein
MRTLRLVVADDHQVVRRGLRMLLEVQSGWEIVAEATDGKEAVKKVLETEPDVTILDIQMPSLNGLEVTREIIERGSKTRILIPSIDESDAMIYRFNGTLLPAARTMRSRTMKGRLDANRKGKSDASRPYRLILKRTTPLFPVGTHQEFHNIPGSSIRRTLT